MDEKYIAITQEWHAKGWNNRQEEVDGLKVEIKKLRLLVGQAGCDIDAYQEGVTQLKTQLAVYKDDMRKDAEKIGELQKRVDLTLNIITDIKKAGIEMEKTPNVRKVGMVLINFMSGLEIALRGAND